MIETYRYNQKWRVKIVNETLEFEKQKELVEILIKLIKLKEEHEPYK